MSVPNSFVQGDTVTWTDTLPDYPSSLWELVYTFINTTNKIELFAQPDGSDGYTITLASHETAQFLPGEYTMIGKVQDNATNTDIHTVMRGCTTIYHDVSALSSHDTRSWAQEALDNVEAVIANRATMDQESYSIQGRSLSRTPLKDLIQLRTYLQSEVLSCEQQNNPGTYSTKKAVVRF